MTVWTAILISVFATSVLSGVIGMAGGLLLMGVLVSLLPVSGAMIVHGAVQATSNGARWLFLRRHMEWVIVPPYIAGAVLVLAGFAAVTLVPEPGVVLMLIGAFPWLARAMPRASSWMSSGPPPRFPAEWSLPRRSSVPGRPGRCSMPSN